MKRKIRVDKHNKGTGKLAFTHIDPKTGKLTNWTVTVKTNAQTEGRRS